MAEAPSGTQWHLEYGAHHAVVVEVGGGLRTYTIGGEPVLDGYVEDAMCDGARGQTLMPWPNRVEDGAYTFDGTDYQLPLSEPERHNAIHGFVRWRNFACLEYDEQHRRRLVVETVLHPRDGFPFTLRTRHEYDLGEDGLTVTTTTTNEGPTAAPYALGFHPYLTVGDERIDGDVLEIDAQEYLPVDGRGIPTGRESVEGSDYDFRGGRRIGAQEIDITLASVKRDEHGIATVTLRRADGSRAATLWVDGAFPYVELYSGDTLPEAGRRRQGLGVEPMTGPPNALRTGIDLVRLDPGASHRSQWGVRATGWPE